LVSNADVAGIMKNLFFWVAVVSSYFFIITDGVNYIQILGSVAGCVLISLLPLYFINWWIYVEKVNFFNFYLINNYIPSFFSVLLPLLMIRKADHIVEVAIVSIFLCIILIPLKQSDFFWKHRFGDLKEYPDDGFLKIDQLKRIRALAMTSIFFPIVAYFIFGFIYSAE
jgi:hypothetical protein